MFTTRANCERILTPGGMFSGFLAQYIRGRPLELCIRCAIYAAQVVIQREGCTFPEKAEFTE